MTIETAQKSDNPWHDDALNRQQFGEALEDHLINRFTAGNHEPLSLALDGRWGSGKTFFVERWTQQLINNNRFVITFNAWQHDGASDPSIALIAELRRQLKELSQRVISPDLTTSKIESGINSTIASAKKAFKPMLRVGANGLLKRAIGSSITEFSNAISDEESDSSPNNDIKIIEKALDTYLDQMLADHELHQSSIAKFQEDLASLASVISETNSLNDQPVGPIIIIIDELDRCRPNFAVQLLEGVKHLFSVKNVCFIFATNLAQLTASIQVVYGANFSGREYLGRFFDRVLNLPAITEANFPHLLFQNPLPNNISMGQYRIYGHPQEARQEVAYWFALSSALGLTLRQQQQAFSIFQISCESYTKDVTLSGVWLMFLSQLKAAHPEIFNRLHAIPSAPSNPADFEELLLEMEWSDKLLYLYPNPNPNPNTNDQLLFMLLKDMFVVSKLSIREADAYLPQCFFPNEIEKFIYQTLRQYPNTNLLGSAFGTISTSGMFTY